MECDCIGGQWAPDNLLMRYQYVSDFFIALAYFSIPIELIYFVKKSAVFPYRWVLVQFGTFIVLCGATHLINMWTFREHTRTVAMVMTIAKVLTAVVSCATALMLVHIIPDLLSVKTRELFLKNKAAELDREMGLIRTQEETGRHVRMLTHEIRSTLDRNTILNTTLFELGKTLMLEECALWIPSRNSHELELSHTLRQQTVHIKVPIQHPTIKQVFSSSRAVVISPNSPVALTRPRSSKFMTGDCVAVRVPLLHLAGFAGGGGAEWGEAGTSAPAYALLVLMLPSDSARRWHVHELVMVEKIAEQVEVALSHAAILEESICARDLLTDQNKALDMARREAETAIRARNDFLAVMNHEMRTPMHAIIALSTLLQETELTPEQRSMVDTVLKSSALLATLINDVLDLSRLEDGSLKLDERTFNLKAVFREAVGLVKPIASVKKLGITLRVLSDVPDVAVGDDKRILQTCLNVIGNAVKFTKEGTITVTVTLEKAPKDPKQPAPPQFQDWKMVPSDKHVYIRVQVKDTGVGVRPEDIRKLFNKFVQADSTTTRSYGGSGLGLAICKRFVSLMQGHIWIESEGPGRGCVVTFIVRLGVVPEKVIGLLGDGKEGTGGATKAAGGTGTVAVVAGKAADFKGTKVLVTDDNSVNRKVTKGLLTRLGCEVTDVSSGRECLSVLVGAGHGFKVLLLDLMMPDMDGYEVAKRLTARLKKEDRPLLVALTANSDRATKEKFLALGGDGVVTKPINQNKMRTVLQELTEHGKVITDFTV
eukprot:TRINITY_DN969_c0_g1_i1.p1 TRINITY_DN969_c0_g1~~TRINITY_DN969_c0_g1_i1.p1  ORF type:complete len:768 (+),score=166.38 TRINITY_DN969_c0_g1_i1:640-2943(+)